MTSSKRFFGLGSLTITSAADASGSLDLFKGRSEPSAVPEWVIFYTEEDAFVGTITVEFSDDNSNWVTANDGIGNDYTLPATAVIRVPVLGRYVRLNSSGDELDNAEVEVKGVSGH